MKRGIALATLAVLLALVACVTKDTTKPVVTIVTPADGDTLAPGNITIKAVATDNKGVTKVIFYVGATEIGSDATGTADTFDVSWTAAAGSYTLKAEAYDAADNMADDDIDVVVATGGGGTGPTPHSGAITADEIWWPSGNPHIIESDVSVRNNATLTIKPGCVVKFAAGTELYCGYSEPGAIVALGTQDSAIIFTSNVASHLKGVDTLQARLERLPDAGMVVYNQYSLCLSH